MQINKNIQIAVAVAILALGANYALAASTWQGPTANPPGNNVDAPINVSSTGQTKSGKLTLGGFALQDGTQALNNVLVSDGDGNASWTDVSGLVGGGVPSGAVMHFDSSSCPSGWTEYASAYGRYILSAPAGGSIGTQIGAALSEGENRPAGAHWHYADGYALPYTTQTGQGNFAGVTGGRYIGVTDTGQDPSKPVGSGALVEGTPAPYVQLLACRKD